MVVGPEPTLDSYSDPLDHIYNCINSSRAMKVNLKSITPNAEVNIVEIARVSSSRQDKSEKPEGLISYLIKNKHWSPFEHSYLTFEIVTSKAIGIQLLRHVSFRFQEFSQRYAKVEAIEPIELRMQAEKNRQSSEEIFDPMLPDIFEIKGTGPTVFDDIIGTLDIRDVPKLKKASEIIPVLMEKLQKFYQYMLEAGVAKECARMILPMATQTTIYMTGSIRSWIHMLDIRDDSHSQREAQLIAKEIKKLFIKELPIISNALNWKHESDKSSRTESGGEKDGSDLSREGTS